MKKSSAKSISILIPVLNEERIIAQLIHYLKKKSSQHNIKELMVIDGGSKDNTVELAKKSGATVLASKKGRALQMNHGAKHAKGDILYFLHADTFPPENFDDHILNAVSNGFKTGCFRMKFDNANWFMNVFAWFSRINHRICRGGDQSLFITKELFLRAKGFNETYCIYEDSEFIGRLYKMVDFKVLPQSVVTSARKYKKNGMFRLQFHFGVIHCKNLLGAPPQELKAYYEKNIVE